MSNWIGEAFSRLVNQTNEITGKVRAIELCSGKKAMDLRKRTGAYMDRQEKILPTCGRLYVKNYSNDYS
jgi:hypothetical protein